MNYVLLISLLSLSFCQSCGSTAAKNVSDCRDLQTSGDAKFCCYVYANYIKDGINTTIEECRGLTQSEHDNIKNIIEKYKKYGGDYGYYINTIQVDCHSKNLSYAILLLLVLMFI